MSKYILVGAGALFLSVVVGLLCFDSADGSELLVFARANCGPVFTRGEVASDFGLSQPTKNASAQFRLCVVQAK